LQEALDDGWLEVVLPGWKLGTRTHFRMTAAGLTCSSRLVVRDLDFELTSTGSIGSILPV
jgi:hypothetical protein